MVGILAAGVLSSQGKMDLSFCIALAFIANTIGSTLLFILGKYYKKTLCLILKTPTQDSPCYDKTKQHGIILLVTQKFIYGLKLSFP